MIFLYGAPASGKTTLGRKLAAAMGRPLVDLDAAIVAAAGRSIPEIFASEGEAGFRAKESRVLAETLQQAAPETIVSLGGGTLLDAANRAAVEAAGLVLCLEAPDEAELARRIGTAAGSRPLGDKARARAAHYASFPHRVAASFEAHGSLVVVGSGFASAILTAFPFVIDAEVANLYGERFGSPLATIPSGEAYKTPATVAKLWQAFATRGLGRRDVVAAVGGGVTGDLTGFAAATWMRGMAWVNVPTTLLSMVDASTGGKTGCDLPEGKNLAGAFHFPRLVAIDVDFLKTLSPELLAAGRAEMIKHEIIGNLPRGTLARDLVPTAREVAANLRVKVDIVEEDPHETKGRRLLLNCGHTIAHAIETLTAYRVSHGEAVAIGCVEEARAAVRWGLAAPTWPDELAARFAAAGLPTTLPVGLDFAAMQAVMKGDKKRRGDLVTWALPCGWGDVRAVPVNMTTGACV